MSNSKYAVRSFVFCLFLAGAGILWSSASRADDSKVTITVMPDDTGATNAVFVKSRVSCWWGLQWNTKTDHSLGESDYDIESPISCKDTGLSATANHIATQEVFNEAGFLTISQTNRAETAANGQGAVAWGNWKDQAENSIVLKVTANAKGHGYYGKENGVTLEGTFSVSVDDTGASPSSLRGGSGVFAAFYADGEPAGFGSRTGELDICIPNGSSILLGLSSDAFARAIGLPNGGGESAVVVSTVKVRLRVRPKTTSACEGGPSIRFKNLDPANPMGNPGARHRD